MGRVVPKFPGRVGTWGELSRKPLTIVSFSFSKAIGDRAETQSNVALKFSTDVTQKYIHTTGSTIHGSNLP